MRISRTLALGASLLVLTGACATGGGGTPSPLTPTPTSGTAAPSGPTGSISPSSAPSTSGEKPTVTIGSAGFPESALLAEIYAQALEADGFTIERTFEIGPRTQTVAGLENGDIDLMPEYIGSLLEELNGGAGEASNDADDTYAALESQAEERGFALLGFAPAEDKNGFVVRQDTATDQNLSKISDLTAVQDDLTWGLPPECDTNPLCGGALTDSYGIDLDAVEIVELGACGSEIAIALDEGAVDVGELCTTQSDIGRFGFVLLEDDMGTQPAENIVPVVGVDLVDSAADLAAVLDPVSEALTTEALTALNVRVEVDQEDREDVAADWLTSEGLLPGS